MEGNLNVDIWRTPMGSEGRTQVAMCPCFSGTQGDNESFLSH